MRGLVVAVVLSIASPAFAHFRLVEPESASTQDGTGNPQFTAPCDTSAPTGAVTQFTTGQQITVSIEELITHPGHYRVALAPTMANLPADPVVNGGNCGSATIQSPPSLPLLADGAFAHTTTLSGIQSLQVTLPAGMTCTNCVLQVIEFFSNHAPPCFHYHCATVNIQDVVLPVDAGPDANGMMGDDGGTGSDGAVGGDDAGSQNALTNPYANQGCSTSSSSNGLFAFLLGALLLRRHEKRRRTP